MPNDSLDSKSDELSIELLLVIMSSSFSTEPKTLVGKMSRLALLKNNYNFQAFDMDRCLYHRSPYVLRNFELSAIETASSVMKSGDFGIFVEKSFDLL